MALKASLNTAGGLGALWAPCRGQGRALEGVLEAKPSEAPEILYFIVPENGRKIQIFPVSCSTKTQDKEPESSKSNLSFINSITDYLGALKNQHHHTLLLCK